MKVVIITLYQIHLRIHVLTNSDDSNSLHFKFIGFIENVQFVPHALGNQDQVVGLLSARPLAVKDAVVGLGESLGRFWIPTVHPAGNMR